MACRASAPYFRARSTGLRSLDVLTYSGTKMKTEPTGQEASRLRQKKFATIRSLQMPEGALPGSLALCHTRCGKPTCHCAKDKGHPVWKLTYMHDGKKVVERIPTEWAEDVQRRVDAGRQFRDAVAEVFHANAQLLVLLRRQTM